MGVRVALVDRARTIRQEPSSVKVAGTTQFAQVESAWFRCRLWIQPQPKTEDPAGGRRRVVSRPRLMYDLRDERGEPVVITAEDNIEVMAVNLGRSVWKLDGDPQPIRKKRSLSHYEATLQRVIDHEFEEAV